MNISNFVKSNKTITIIGSIMLLIVIFSIIYFSTKSETSPQRGETVIEVSQTEEVEPNLTIEKQSPLIKIFDRTMFFPKNFMGQIKYLSGKDTEPANTFRAYNITQNSSKVLLSQKITTANKVKYSPTGDATYIFSRELNNNNIKYYNFNTTDTKTLSPKITDIIWTNDNQICYIYTEIDPNSENEGKYQFNYSDSQMIDYKTIFTLNLPDAPEFTGPELIFANDQYIYYMLNIKSKELYRYQIDSTDRPQQVISNIDQYKTSCDNSKLLLNFYDDSNYYVYDLINNKLDKYNIKINIENSIINNNELISFISEDNQIIKINLDTKDYQIIVPEYNELLNLNITDLTISEDNTILYPTINYFLYKINL